MARVVFTQNLMRHVAVPPGEAPGTTVCEVLGRVFEKNAVLRGYVLDDQDRLRPNMVIFVNGQAIADRAGLSDPVDSDDEIYVMQALSGG